MENTYNKIAVGIDNGVSGSIGIIYPDGATELSPTPIRKTLNYTKKKGFISRVDVEKLKGILEPLKLYSRTLNGPSGVFVAMERPMVNPGRFQATVSALRALEATLIVLEQLELPYMYIDSKEWQKMLLPSGIVGSDELKAASAEVGRRLFPSRGKEIKKDADALLIAEYVRRKQL